MPRYRAKDGNTTPGIAHEYFVFPAGQKYSVQYGDKKFQETRYEYSLEKLFENKIDKLLALSILYKYLKTEVTQYDKWGKVARVLTHEEITELLVSKEFREFISFEQVNFYLDNQELFEMYL